MGFNSGFKGLNATDITHVQPLLNVYTLLLWNLKFMPVLRPSEYPNAGHRGLQVLISNGYEFLALTRRQV